jgi:hypothetical protein
LSDLPRVTFSSEKPGNDSGGMIQDTHIPQDFLYYSGQFSVLSSSRQAKLAYELHISGGLVIF